MMLRRSLLLGSSLFNPFVLFPTATHAEVLDRSRPIDSFSSPSRYSSASSSLIPQSPPSTLVRRDPDPTKNKFLTPEPFGVPGDFSNDTSYATESQTIEIEWVSEWQSVDLSICQPTEGSSVGCYALIRGTLSKGFHWPVENATQHMSGFASPPIPNVYYFTLAQTNTVIPTIQSHYFNITKGANDTTSDGDGDGDGSETANSSTTSASNATAFASTTATGTSSSATESPSGSSALTTSARLAIGLVSSILFAGLCGAGIFWLILRQRKRKRATRLAKVAITQSSSTLTSSIPLQEMHSESYVHETGKALPHEISSKEVPMELPAEVPGLALSTYDNRWDVEGVEHTNSHERLR